MGTEDFATLAVKLNQSARKYRKDLLRLPCIGIEEALKYMTPRPGLSYEETVGGISGDSELRPYNGENNVIVTLELGERTIAVHLGSCVELFDPNSLRQTLWAQLNAHSGRVENSDMNAAILFEIMNQVMTKLNVALWKGVRNASGTTTLDLFNGLDTITAAEIVAATISVVNGNYTILTEAITDNNAYDQIKAIYRAASPELRAKKTFLEVPFEIYDDYIDDYQATVGPIIYNDKFEQVYVEGSSKRCMLVPLVGKEDSNYIHLTTKRNQLYGYGGGVQNEKIEVRRGDNAFKLQYILAMFFGVQFKNISKKNLLVAQLAPASSS